MHSTFSVEHPGSFCMLKPKILGLLTKNPALFTGGVDDLWEPKQEGLVFHLDAFHQDL